VGVQRLAVGGQVWHACACGGGACVRAEDVEPFF